jgi:hypothetical protein
MPLHPATGYTAILYISGPTLIGAAWGLTLPNGWEGVAAADFNSDGDHGYVLYNAGTRQTAIWYLNNNLYVGSACGPDSSSRVEPSAAVSEISDATAERIIKLLKCYNV